MHASDVHSVIGVVRVIVAPGRHSGLARGHARSSKKAVDAAREATAPANAAAHRPRVTNLMNHNS